MAQDLHAVLIDFFSNRRLSLCQGLARRRSRVKPYNQSFPQHGELARGGASVIHLQVRFLQGVAVKKVVVREGNPRLGEDFFPC